MHQTRNETSVNPADEPSALNLRTFLTNSVPQFILSGIHLGAKVDTQAVHAIRFMRFMQAMPGHAGP